MFHAKILKLFIVYKGRNDLSQVNVRPARWAGMRLHCLPEDLGSMGMTLLIYMMARQLMLAS